MPQQQTTEKQNLINKLINKSSLIIVSVSVKTQNIPLLEEFRKISKAESGSRGFSQTALKAFAEYVQKHGLGNSQIKISNYCIKEPTPSAHFCNHSKGNTNDGLVFCSNPSKTKSYERNIEHGVSGLWVSGITCYSCDFNKMRVKRSE